MILLIGSVNAIAIIDEIYNISVSCDGLDCSNLNITVLYPNSTIFINEKQMIDNTAYATYNVTPTVFGDYQYYLYDGTNFSSGSFMASGSGYELTTASSVVYLGLFIMSIFLFAVTLMGINLLPSANKRNEQGKIMQISYLKYLRGSLWLVGWALFVGILFLASNLSFSYLGEELFAQFFFVVFRITLGITPIIIIVWMAWFYAKFVQDREFQKLIKRGIFKEQL